MEIDDLVHEINRRCRGTHCEWPAKAMLSALIARCVYQHPSIESLCRELARNPSLMRSCGFENYGDGFNDIAYRVPSKSAFSRFIAVLLEVERDTASVSQMQQRLSDQLVRLRPGFDGKARRSRRTARHQTLIPPEEATLTATPTAPDASKRWPRTGSTTNRRRIHQSSRKSHE